ncbi:MAG: hypothetical protein ACOYT9_01575, partial [Patescibacteria group bacterium]
MQLWKTSARPEPVEKKVVRNEQAETVALVQVTDKARRVLEEFGFPPADFGLEATTETLGQDDTLIPTSKWKVFNPKAENKRIYDMDRDEYPESTMIPPAHRTPLTEYRARCSTVDYGHFSVTVVIKPYQLKQKRDDSPTDFYPDLKVGEWYPDYSIQKVGLLIQRTPPKEGTDVPTIFIKAKTAPRGKDNSAPADTRLAYDTIIYAQSQHEQKAVRYAWMDGSTKGMLHPDMHGYQPPKVESPIEEGIPATMPSPTKRLRQMLPSLWVSPAAQQIAPDRYPTMVSSPGTIAQGFESDVFVYLRRYRESPVEGAKHLIEFIKKDLPIPAFVEQEDPAISEGLALLAQRGVKIEQAPDVATVRVAMENANGLSSQEAGRIDFTESARLLLSTLDLLHHRSIYSTYLSDDIRGKTSEKLRWGRLLSYGIGDTNGGTTWAIVEKFRSGFTVHKDWGSNTIIVGAASQRARTTEEYKTRSIFVRCEKKGFLDPSENIRAIEYAEDERLETNLRLISVQIETSSFRGVLFRAFAKDG